MERRILRSVDLSARKMASARDLEEKLCFDVADMADMESHIEKARASSTDESSLGDVMMRTTG